MNNGPHLSFPHTFSSSVNSLMKDLGRGERRGGGETTTPTASFGSFGQTSPKDSNRRHLRENEWTPEHNTGAVSAVFQGDAFCADLES